MPAIQVVSSLSSTWHKSLTRTLSMSMLSFCMRLTIEYTRTPESASPVPTMFKKEAGVLKKAIEAAITTTRFTQLPTECVTGITL